VKQILKDLALIHDKVLSIMIVSGRCDVMYEDSVGESDGSKTPMGTNIKASEDLKQIIDSFRGRLDELAEAEHVNV
jgi:hypothetical protein